MQVLKSRTRGVSWSIGVGEDGGLNQGHGQACLVEGLGFGDQDAGSRVQDRGLRAQGFV